MRSTSLLEELLLRVSNLIVKAIAVEPSDLDKGVYLLVSVRSGKNEYLLACEVKQSGQPRFAREAINPAPGLSFTIQAPNDTDFHRSFLVGINPRVLPRRKSRTPGF
jgi:hypothetical protein